MLLVGGGDDDWPSQDHGEADVYKGRGQRRALRYAADAIRERVAEGLLYVGICAGAYLGSQKRGPSAASHDFLTQVKAGDTECVRQFGCHNCVWLLLHSTYPSIFRRTLLAKPSMRCITSLGGADGSGRSLAAVDLLDEAAFGHGVQGSVELVSRLEMLQRAPLCSGLPQHAWHNEMQN